MDRGVRRVTAFPCAGETLVGTLDAAEGATGVLIVSGGNEARWGAHRGMAALAARLAAAGVPVLRYDRRGVGDSSGANGGFRSSGPDMAAAAAAFRAEQPQLTRLVGFGNCDAATALALFGRAAGVDALVLANPWVVESDGPLPPRAAIRARYADRLRDWREWKRLVTGGVDLRGLARGLRRAAAPPERSGLAEEVAAALGGWAGVTVLLAKGDNTAVAFAETFKRAAFAGVRARVRVERRATASHSFAREGDEDWVFERLTEAVAAEG